MKNIKYLFLLLTITVLALSSCKYEEGPAISMRSKRDRVANEWRVTGYKLNGNESDSNKNTYNSGDSIELVFVVTRESAYAFNMDYTAAYAATKPEGQRQLSYSKPEAPGIYARLQNDFKANCLFVKKTKNGGRWSFVNSNKRLRFGTVGNPDIAYSENNGDGFFEADIVMLKNKMLKLKFMDGNEEHVITFEPKNPERVK